MSSNFGQIGPKTTELAALEHLRNTPIDVLLVYLPENYSKYVDNFTCWLSGERSLPFWLLAKITCKESGSLVQLRVHVTGRHL